MPTLPANGLDIHYTQEGAGPPLVLLHAATSSALADWAAQRPALRKHFTLFLPDARGHARTSWDADGGWSQELLIADLLAFVDALGLQRFHVAGLSMGAGTALRFAMRHPERLRSAIIAAAGIDREPRGSVARRVLVPDSIERDDPAWAARLASRHDRPGATGTWKKLLDAIREDILGQEPPTPEELRLVRLPVLLAYGDRDPWVPLEQAVRMRRQLPDAKLFVSPGVGHVVIAERPSLFNQAALSFLRLSSGQDG